VEVLVVLAVLVLIAAVAWPAIQKPLVRRQVQTAADTVRSKLFHARIGAMRSSHVYTFQYQPGSGSYRFSPQDQTSAGQQADDAAQPASDPLLADGEHLPSEDCNLPDGVRFLADDTPDPDAAEPTSTTVAQSGDGGNGWSDPVFFYPDGTTSDARLVVASGRGYAIHIRLRGVTGNVILGSPVVE
jgi:type II secretory pathway pseudopilin PulG